MVIVKIMGGLGNQLYQYAFGRAVAKKLNTELYFDISFYEKQSKRVFQLDHFDIKGRIADDSLLPPAIKNNGIVKLLSRIQDKLFPKVQKYYEEGIYFDQKVFDLRGDVYFSGYWQNEEYFLGIKDILKAELQLKKKPTIPFDLLNKITQTESVSIHIRRGDYISESQNQEIYECLGTDYYEKSISHIEEFVKNPHFFIFSDDIEEAHNILSIKENFTFVSALDSLSDFYLMSLCKHNIIANSTFSWWASWLNLNEQRILIKPDKWYKNER